MKLRIAKFYLDTAMRDITALGTVPYHAIFLVFLLLFSQYGLFYTVLLGEILVYVISVFLKLAFFKNRPQRMGHENILEKIEASSFPSVHTARIFFVSILLMLRINNLMVAAFLLLLSLFVAYSRIYLKKHYFVDVLAGAALGSVLGYVVAAYI